ERNRSDREGDYHRERQGELPPYRQAVRFAAEPPASRTYRAVQGAIFTHPAGDLSVYRLGVNDLWYVTVLGLPPPPDLADRIAALLATGTTTELPPELWHALAERRRQASRQGPWVERHFRPSGGS